MIEPPTCVPIATGIMLAPTAAAEPEDEPPGVRSASNGLVVGPGCEPPSSAVTVLARMSAPAWRNAQTPALSRLGKLPFIAAQPISVGMSLVSSRSLMATGMPSIGDRGLPAFQRAALASAAARARLVEGDEGLHHRLALRDGFKATLQVARGLSFPSVKRRVASWKVSGL